MILFFFAYVFPVSVRIVHNQSIDPEFSENCDPRHKGLFSSLRYRDALKSESGIGALTILPVNLNSENILTLSHLTLTFDVDVTHKIYIARIPISARFQQ